mmetsp:Transcript_70345/g.151569  ORF Transcript_70345/g.151569 Transcript_70345/m.151569 type:complete len:84 (+) Transcript_70345:981-1232(+)
MVSDEMELNKMTIAEMKELKKRFNVGGIEKQEIIDKLARIFNEQKTSIEDCKMLKSCEHIFHESCLIKWFKSNNTCPTCYVRL